MIGLGRKQRRKLRIGVGWVRFILLSKDLTLPLLNYCARVGPYLPGMAERWVLKLSILVEDLVVRIVLVEDLVARTVLVEDLEKGFQYGLELGQLQEE